MEVKFSSNVIHVYSRADALADEVLVDVTSTAKEAGFKLPVALAQSVWGNLDPDEEALSCGESKEGRLWDCLFMCAFAIRRGDKNRSTVPFSFYVTLEGVATLVTMYAMIGPGDQYEPVITIMSSLSEE